MRIFVGIEFDEQTKSAIEKFLKPFKKIGTPIKWVRPENIHLTLKFLGEVTDAQWRSVEKALAETDFNTGPFTLDLTGCGKFGRGGDLNIFWIGVEKNPLLEDLYHRIEACFAGLGFPREKRPFKPHITVGRNKRVYNFKSLFELVDQKEVEKIATFEVGAFQVVKSDLLPEGPRYTVLKEVPVVAA